MNIYFLEIFDIENFNQKNDNFKSSISFLSYILLSYIYYKIYGKELDFSNIIKFKNKKPYLKNNEIYFNISHCKNHIAIAISKFEVGIDIENERNINKNAISKFLSEQDMKDNFFTDLEYWVLKEAYSKYIGLGLNMNFKNIDKYFLAEKCKKKELFCYEILSEQFICFSFSKVSLQNIFFIKKEEILEYYKNFYIKNNGNCN